MNITDGLSSETVRSMRSSDTNLLDDFGRSARVEENGKPCQQVRIECIADLPKLR